MNIDESPVTLYVTVANALVNTARLTQTVLFYLTVSLGLFLARVQTKYKSCPRFDLAGGLDQFVHLLHLMRKRVLVFVDIDRHLVSI